MTVKFGSFADISPLLDRQIEELVASARKMNEELGLSVVEPTSITNLTATGGLGHILLEYAYTNYNGHLYTEVWRSDNNVFANGVRVGATAAKFYRDQPPGALLTDVFYYWVRNVNINGVAADWFGPVNGSVSSSASWNIDDLLAQLGFEHFAPGTMPVRTVSALPDLSTTPANWPVGSLVYLTTNQKLYKNENWTWGAVVNTVDLVGEIVEKQVADGAINTAKFAAGIEPVAIVNGLPTAAGYTGAKVGLNTIDGVIYRYIGGAWTKAVASGDITGQLTNAQLEDIATSKLTGTITETQIADNAISTPKIAAGAISTAKLAAGAITAETIAAGAVTATQLAAGSVIAGKVAAGAISASEIASGAITTDKLAADAITADKIAARTITGQEIAVNGITADNLAANSVSAVQLTANSVVAGKIAAGALAVNDGVMQNGYINNAMIQDAAISNAKIQDAAISNAKIQDGAITTAKIGAVTIGYGAITGGPPADADRTSDNKAMAIDRPDTRAVNSPPSYYYGLGRGIYSEFKTRTVIGSPGSGIYVSLTTDVPWVDVSGGPVIQTCSPGDNIYRRKSVSDTTWGAWQTIVDGADRTADALSATTAITSGGLKMTNTATGNYVQMTPGELEFYESGVLYKSLRRVETGTVDSGQAVVFSPPFKSTPFVMLSPNDLPTYDNTYVSSLQSLECVSLGLNEGGFLARADLVISGSGNILYSYSTIQITTASCVAPKTTIQTTTQSNVTQVTFRIQVLDRSRIGGQVAFSYRISGSGSAYTSAFTVNYSGGTYYYPSISFPSAQRWEVRIVGTANSVDVTGGESPSANYGGVGINQRREYLGSRTVVQSGTMNYIAIE